MEYQSFKQKQTTLMENIMRIRKGYCCLGLLITALVTQGKDLHVDNAHPNANDQNSGSLQQPYKTISMAAELAVAGDTIIIHEGVYREQVEAVNSGKKGEPITFKSADGEKVVIKGSDIFTPTWEVVKTKSGKTIYRGKIEEPMFKDYKLPWKKSHSYTTNPFHTKIIISEPRAKERDKKRNFSQIARPWSLNRKIKKVDTEGRVTFDTYTQNLTFDGPAGTLPRTLGQVFVNGKPLQQMRRPEEVENFCQSFIVGAEGEYLYLNLGDKVNPKDHFIEITTRAQIFTAAKRGLGYIHIKGLTLEQCANQGPFPQAGALSLRSGNNWLVENNTIRYAKTVGIDVGGECFSVDAISRRMKSSNCIIRNNTISDNGLCGIAGYNSKNLLIKGNILERNNRMGYTPWIDIGWWEQSAIKLHLSPGSVIEENLIRDNDCFGVWLDTHYANSRITRNLIVNNQSGGIFTECGYGPALIDNNVIAFTRSGHGIYCHDSSGVTLANNLSFRNAYFGILIRNVTERKSGRKRQVSSTSNNKIINNVVLGNSQGAIAIPIKSERNKDNICDYNVVSGGSHIFDNGDALFGLISREDRDAFKKDIYKEYINKGLAFPITWKDEELVWTRLNIWSKITGWDTNSIEPFGLKDRYMTFRSRLLNLELDIPESFANLKGPSIKDVTIDYMGQKINKKSAPGPFQSLKTGRNVFYLWPLKNK